MAIIYSVPASDGGSKIADFDRPLAVCQGQLIIESCRRERQSEITHVMQVPLHNRDSSFVSDCFPVAHRRSVKTGASRDRIAKHYGCVGTSCRLSGSILHADSLPVGFRMRMRDEFDGLKGRAVDLIAKSVIILPMRVDDQSDRFACSVSDRLEHVPRALQREL